MVFVISAGVARFMGQMQAPAQMQIQPQMLQQQLQQNTQQIQNMQQQLDDVNHQLQNHLHQQGVLLQHNTTTEQTVTGLPDVTPHALPALPTVQAPAPCIATLQHPCGH